MNTRNKNTCIVALTVAAAMQFGMLTSFAQTDLFLFTGSETTINLNPGTYDITAYGAQGGGGYSGGGAGWPDGGGGGGSIIDSSAIMALAEVSGVASPDDSPNGEVIITSEVPEPTTLALAGLSGLVLRLFRRQRK